MKISNSRKVVYAGDISEARMFMYDVFGIPVTADVIACKNLIHRVRNNDITEDEFMSITEYAQTGLYKVAAITLHKLLYEKAMEKRNAKDRYKPAEPVYADCITCGKEFRRNNVRVKNCSSKCSVKYKKQTYKKLSFDDKACKECNSVFQPRAYIHMFCSRICGSNYRYKVGKS